jgi:hypothetical protein
VNLDLTGTYSTMLKLIDVMLALKNESVTTTVGSYGDSGVMTENEHNAMHSTLHNSNVSFPHSFLFTPVHKIPGDSDSKIVAFVSGGFAWDVALRFLLPDNIEGIVVEIQNSCNQTVTYELMGHDAFYLGDNVTHESIYDNMRVVRDLSPSKHPNFTTTEGHCLYTVVRSLHFYFTNLIESHIYIGILILPTVLRLFIESIFFQAPNFNQIPYEYSQSIRWCCGIHICLSCNCIYHLRYSCPSSQ